MIEVDIPADGVYANISIERWVQYYGPEYTSRQDWIFARFDEVYDPETGVSSLQPAAVTVDAWELAWDDGENQYQYTMVENGHTEFLGLGEDYEVTVGAGDGVPALLQGVTFPASEPCITSHATMDTVSLGGFTLEWTNTGADQVTIHIMESGAEGVPTLTVETDNAGSHTFGGNDLAGLQGPMLGVELICGGEVDVVAEGYDSRSVISVRTYNWINLWVRDE